VTGQEAYDDPQGIIAAFSLTAPQPDLVLDAGTLPPSQPSTVVDLSGRVPRILRQGAVRADKILPYL
jgi:tRNA A37 threonylcarbamoyladenosine synthetase subunit TsaC/SUA5/YrdC